MRKYIFLFFILFLILPLGALAADAQLFLNSGAGVYQVNRTFTPSIVVNSGGLNINTVGVVLKYNPKDLAVQNITKDGSICNYWPIGPKFSNTDGKIVLACGSPKAYKGSYGIIANITFKVLRSIKTFVQFDTDKSLATSTVLTAEADPRNILKDARKAVYIGGNATAVANAKALVAKLSGRILLQVQKNGEAWYIYPKDLKRYYLGRPADAFAIMRKLGLGVKHSYIKSYTTYPKAVSGKILLDVEDKGKAYYIYPVDRKAYYLGRPADAFAIMRQLGLGISNDVIDQIPDWSI